MGPAGQPPPDNWLTPLLRGCPTPTPTRPVIAAVHLHRHGNAGHDLHPGFEFGLVLAGEHERSFPQYTLPVRHGDAWLVRGWELHGYRTVPGTEVVVVLFLPQFLGEEMVAGVPWISLFSAPPGERPRVRTPQSRQRILRIGAELRQELFDRAEGWEEAVRYNLLRALLALRRGWEPPAIDHSPGPGAAADLARVEPALEALHADLQHRLTRAEAAARCGVSPSRFAVLFRRTMGVSFGRFTVHARLAQAAHRLITTDHPVEDIAVQLGFTDGSHLHHLFVRQYALTPAAYRRQMR